MADTKHADPFQAVAEKGRARGSQPQYHQHGVEVQRFGEMRLFPIALSHDARAESSQLLNQVLADSIILYNLYKKHHWLMRGPTFYQLHLLLDKHAGEQLALIDLMGELNASAEEVLNDAYAKATARRPGSVVLNFERADYINSTGIALIVGLLARARRHGIEVKAFGLSDHYREIFEITRLADFMTITDNEERAVSGATGRTDA